MSFLSQGYLLPYEQSHFGISLIEMSSFQVTIGCVQLTIKTNQDSVHLCVHGEEEGQSWILSAGILPVYFEMRFLTGLEITN